MKLHILGVCGTYMGGIARLAAAKGHEVVGTDRAYYEPMAQQLRDIGVQCRLGFEKGNLDDGADVYVVGNVIRRTDAVCDWLLGSRARFCSGPQWLADEILADCDRLITVAGTHGKTTTTSMIVHILQRGGLQPGYLIGGVSGVTGRSADLGAGKVMVVEADEYDCAFFDKRPKFTHYWPDVAVVNNIEFDHADIYPDLAAVKRQFALLPRTIRPGGKLVGNWADASVREMAEPASWCERIGFNEPAGWHWQDGQLACGARLIGSDAAVPAGEHNRSNALAAIAASVAAGVEADAALAAFDDYRLPRRRLETIHASAELVVVDDFAHHPTSIRTTLAGLAGLYPQRRLVAVLDPRSNTMRAGVWRDQLGDSLAAADAVYALDDDLDWDLAAALDGKARLAGVFGRAQTSDLVQALCQQQNSVVVLLSNGDIDELRASLVESLDAAAARD